MTLFLDHFPFLAFSALTMSCMDDTYAPLEPQQCVPVILPPDLGTWSQWRIQLAGGMMGPTWKVPVTLCNGTAKSESCTQCVLLKDLRGKYIFSFMQFH